MHYDFCLIGAKDTTVTMAKHVIEHIGKPDCIITIDADRVNTENISGFAPIDQVAEQAGIHLFKAKEYSLKDAESMAFFSQNTFSIAVCMGWQRLIPQYVLERFPAGIFGFHGSCGYLPYGRGRSPLNWSIINGDTRFILNLFRYDEKADSPNVFANRMFQINPFDTIRTLQLKNLLCSFTLVEELMAAYKTGNIQIHTQSQDFDSLYPKRGPADGKIDFTKKTREIYNLVRGVTKPFPGAFAFINGEEGKKVTVWEAVPFDEVLDFSRYCAGQVAAVLDGMPIVRTVDGSILIKRYQGDVDICPGDILR